MKRHSVTMEMPKYKCHKEVWALKIKHVILPTEESEEYFLEFEDDRYAKKSVTPELVEKRGAKGGGYYVVYQDGYESWSPADAFESGYTLIG